MGSYIYVQHKFQDTSSFFKQTSSVFKFVSRFKMYGCARVFCHFSKGDNFCNFLFAFLENKHLSKMAYT